MNGALDAPPLAVAAHGGGIVLAAHLDHLARGVLLEIGALDDVGVAQADLGPRRQPEVLLGGDLAEVVLLDPELPAEGHLSRARGGVFGVVDRLHLLDLALGVVLHDELERAQDGHATLRPLVQVLPHPSI